MKDRNSNRLYINNIIASDTLLNDDTLRVYKIYINFKNMEDQLTWFYPIKKDYDFKYVKRLIVKLLSIMDTKIYFKIKKD